MTTPKSDYTGEAEWVIYQNLVAEAVHAMEAYLQNPAPDSTLALKKYTARPRASRTNTGNSAGTPFASSTAKRY
jgi:hypothetical protein